MSNKEQLARRYTDNLMQTCRPFHVKQYGLITAKNIATFDAYYLEKSYRTGWSEALKQILVDVNKKLPKYDEDVLVINEAGEKFFCHRSNNSDVQVDKNKWCNYSGSDIIAWMRNVTFDEILMMNKEVLKRLKKK